MPAFKSQLRCTTAIVLLTSLLSGCAASSSVPVPPELVYGYAGGDFITEFDAPAKTVADTATEVMTSLGLTDQSVRIGDERGFMSARASRGELVTLRLRKGDGGITRVMIRYGVFGNEQKSVDLAEQIRTRLKARAKPAEPPRVG